MAKAKSVDMSNDRRGLLTDREREILLSNGEDISDNYYGVVVTRVRRKIELIETDLEALAQHETLADELRETVCNDATPESDTQNETESVSDSDSDSGSIPTVEDGLNPDAVREDVVNE